MPEAPVYIVSDIHLGAVPPETESAFCAWLDAVGSRASRLIINGDLFDFWFEYGSVIPRGHTRVLGGLARLVDAGIPVDFMGGNHDWWGGSYLTDEIGLRLHTEPVILDLAGRRTLLAHGDGLGKGDLGYRALRLILRGRATRWAFRWLHPDVGAWVARRVSRTEGRDAVPEESREARIRFLREWALARLAEEPDLEIVALGHCHRPEVLEAHEGRYYVNAGDWVDNRSFVVLEEGAPPRLEEWSEG